MIESREEDTVSNAETTDTSEENDPWANDGSILPDASCQYYQLLPQPDDDDESSNDDYDQASQSNVISLDIADSLLRGLEEDYRATHACTFSASLSEPSKVEVKEFEDDVGEAPIEEIETKDSATLDENDGNTLFPVHWNDSKPDADIDITAVRKTVQDITDDKTSKFMQKYSAWQQRQQGSHPIIPSAPYQAFLRETDKAKRATASLSRSATIAESLWRCQRQNLLHPADHTLVVDVVGVDHVECASISKIQETFRPIIRWLGAWDEMSTLGIHTVELRLIGRDLSKSVSAEPIDLLTQNVKSSLNKATAICYSEICYHDWRATVERNPDLILAFNAGIWGYVEWAPTLRALGQGSIPTPTVITSYTLEESQEDFESIEEAVTKTTAKVRVQWGPEPNPFGSKMIRETKSSTREYRENSAWQMWLLGGDSSNTES